MIKFCNFLAKSLGIAFTLLCAGAAGAAPDVVVSPPWASYGKVFEAEKPAGTSDQGKGTVVVYRELSPESKFPIAVYVNGRYLSSLMPGAYVEHAFCAGTAEISTTLVDDSAVRGEPVKGIAVQIKPGSAQYLSIGAAAGGKATSVKAVDAASHGQLAIKKQVHAIHRVKDCS